MIDQQSQDFSDELDRLVERFRAEYDLSYAQMVGVLTIKAHLLVTESIEDED